MSADARLQLVPPVAQTAEALAPLSTRDAVAVLVAGYRAARDAFDREVLASRARTERLLAAVEQWSSTGVMPPLANRLVELFESSGGGECKRRCGRCGVCREVAELAADFWGSIALDDFTFSLICNLHSAERGGERFDAERVLEHSRNSVSECLDCASYTERVENALEATSRAALKLPAA